MNPIFGVTQKKLLNMASCMDRACCSTSGFSLFLDDSTTTRFTGSGTFQDPIKSNVKISAESGNTIIVKPDGLYSAGGTSGLTEVITEDSDSISFTGLGTIESPLSATFIGNIPIGSLQTVTDVGNSTNHDIIISSNTGTLSQFSVYNAAANSIAAIQTYVDDIHGDVGTSTLFLQGYQRNSIMFSNGNSLIFELDNTNQIAELHNDGRFTGTSAVNPKDFVTLDQLPAASAAYTFSDTGFTI